MSSQSSFEAKPFDAQELVGHIFAERYRILSVLGQGGMGVVYKAEHVHMSKLMAIKMLLPGAVSNEDGFSRFRQEARAIATLSHPGIVAVHDFGITQEGQAFL